MIDHPTADGPEHDRALLARLGTHPAAFEAFYRRHVDRITGFAVRRCEGPEEVADLVAAVFLAVVESAHRYDPDRGEPVSWLFGIAANQLKMQRRSGSRQRRVAVRVSGQRLLDADDVRRLEERIDAERLAEPARRAVARLPRGERMVFELMSRDGLTAAQAGAALRISPAAVRVRLSRARTKLRRELGDALGEGFGEGFGPGRSRSAPPPDTTSTFRPTTTEEVAL